MGYTHPRQTLRRQPEAARGRPAPVAGRPAAAAPPMHTLQQSIGNQAVGRLIQARLRIGRPGDRFEREADRVAAEVTRAPTAPGVIRRKCARCEQEEPRRAPHAVGRPVPEGAAASEAVARGLRGPGRPLPASERAFFEPRLGRDLGDVRLHAGAGAAGAARALAARAFTLGSDIAFDAGAYAPGTAAGRRLLAHELTHVVQQTGRAPQTVMRAIAFNADCAAEDREEAEGNVTRAQESARRWAEAAARALTRPEDAAGLLRRHFDVRATDAASVGRIRGGLETIAALLGGDAFTYHCRPGSDARCTTADGSQVKGFAYAGRRDVFFCDPFPYQDFFGHRSLIDTLLHEAAHAHDAAFNHDTYEWQDAYPGPNPLTNADAYASFARDAALGRPQRLFIAPELSVGGLFAADPQFYISVGSSAEIGGPWLDFVNLKAGLRLAYTPATEAQPTRGLGALDVGLRLNPIGRRVYVDVTTGAFAGANYTDNEAMLGIANRITAGYRGERLDLGLELSQFRGLIGAEENLIIIGVRGAFRP